MNADMRELLDIYEASGDETAFTQAKALYERALAHAPDPVVVRDYGYLLECHARYALRQAIAQYEHALTLDPDADKPHYHLISADAALADWRRAIELDPEDISPLYSSAFLLERQNRLDEAIQAWSAIRDWAHDRGYTRDTEWPTRELDRLTRMRAIQ